VRYGAQLLRQRTHWRGQYQKRYDRGLGFPEDICGFAYDSTPLSVAQIRIVVITRRAMLFGLSVMFVFLQAGAPYIPTIVVPIAWQGPAWVWLFVFEIINLLRPVRDDLAWYL